MGGEEGLHGEGKTGRDKERVLWQASTHLVSFFVYEILFQIDIWANYLFYGIKIIASSFVSFLNSHGEIFICIFICKDLHKMNKMLLSAYM